MDAASHVPRRWRRALSGPAPPAAVWLGLLAGATVFLIVVFVRGGPISAQNDAQVVTAPTTAVSHGDFRQAEAETLGADPPGYPLFAAPMVALLRPWVGASSWCTDQPLPPVIARGPQAAFYRRALHLCADQRTGGRATLPPWYRSQALLGVVGWLVLALGVGRLLRAVHGRRSVAEVVAPLGLALVPATSDTLVESFHPQDLLCVGLMVLALSQALRRRWLVVGGLFGLALLCKQFAVLGLLGVVVYAPDRRARAVVVGVAAAVGIAGLAPFLATDPSDTWHALSGTYVAGGGVIRSGTAVGLLGIDESLKLRIARDVPVVVSALAMCAVWWRARPRRIAPETLLGLVLFCLATRLVFEASIFGYYLLAVSVLVLVLDLALGRPPLAALLWVLATRYGVLELPSVVGPGWVAAAFLVCSLAAAALGLGPVAAFFRSRTAAPASSPAGPRRAAR